MWEVPRNGNQIGFGELDSLQDRRTEMAEEQITTKTTEVRVEKQPGTDVKATVKKDGNGGSATAPTMQGAVDKAADLSKK